jgi:hypothetical protein
VFSVRDSADALLAESRRDSHKKHEEGRKYIVQSLVFSFCGFLSSF